MVKYVIILKFIGILQFSQTHLIFQINIVKEMFLSLSNGCIVLCKFPVCSSVTQNLF